jgi:hypothetical protein
MSTAQAIPHASSTTTLTLDAMWFPTTRTNPLGDGTLSTRAVARCTARSGLVRRTAIDSRVQRLERLSSTSIPQHTNFTMATSPMNLTCTLANVWAMMAVILLPMEDGVYRGALPQMRALLKRTRWERMEPFRPDPSLPIRVATRQAT